MKMKTVLTILVVFLLSDVRCQNLVDQYFAEVDSTYREDQFYIGLGINFLTDKPKDMVQSGLSGGVHFGFIRDMPINTRRNISIGIGAGLSIDTYSQNLFIGEESSGHSIFDVIDNDVEYSTNRFATHVFEIPIQFRWRTSNIGDNTSFWRIYTGINIGYMYFFNSTFEQLENRVSQTKLDELNRTRFAFYFSFGKSKINFFFRYSLIPLFDAELIDTEAPVNIDIIKAGLVFYIL